jgi:hypothetical protein
MERITRAALTALAVLDDLLNLMALVKAMVRELPKAEQVLVVSGWLSECTGDDGYEAYR